MLLGEEQVVLGASIGIAFGGVLTDGPEVLLRREADLAMYLAKRAGTDCYRVFEGENAATL